MSTTLADVIGFVTEPDTYEVRYEGHKVRFLNEDTFSSTSQFYVAGFEFGPSVLVHVDPHRGDGFEDAWSIWIDESPTISEDELIEAYGPEGSIESFRDLAPDDATAREMLAACENPDLLEGYKNQSNASGTGIVDVGHYAWMNPADLSLVTVDRKGSPDHG